GSSRGPAYLKSRRVREVDLEKTAARVARADVPKARCRRRALRDTRHTERGRPSPVQRKTYAPRCSATGQRASTRPAFCLSGAQNPMERSENTREHHA